MDQYTEYASIDAQIKELEAKKDAIKATILSEMSSNGIKKFEHSLGKFSITLLKKWEYPEEVKELGEEFKTAKAKAESTGDATYTESESLRFTALSL